MIVQYLASIMSHDRIQLASVLAWVACVTSVLSCYVVWDAQSLLSLDDSHLPYAATFFLCSTTSSVSCHCRYLE